MSDDGYNFRKRTPTKTRNSVGKSPKSATKRARNQREGDGITGEEDDSMDTSVNDLDSTSSPKSVNTSLNTSREDGDGIRVQPKIRKEKVASPVYETNVSQRTDNKDKQQPTPRSSCASCFCVIVLIAVFVFTAYFVMENQNFASPSFRNPDLIHIFNGEMKKLMTKFPTQTERFWKVLRVSLRRIIADPFPEYPSVLLLVVPSGSRSSETGSCIAKHLTKTINTLYNVTSAKVINIPSDITHSNPDDEKKDLDRLIHESFENQHLRSIALDHFEQLSPRASLLFHGYCDGDNAPFKNVAIVFVLHTDINIESLRTDRTGSLIDRHLVELWSKTAQPLDIDKIEPLIARIANNPAIVTEDINLKCH